RTRRRSSGRWPRPSPGGRASSSPTACRRSPAPTRSWSSPTVAWSSGGGTPTCWPRAACTPTSTGRWCARRRAPGPTPRRSAWPEPGRGPRRPARAGRRRSALDPALQEGDVVLAALVRGLAHDRGAGRLDDGDQQLRVDGAGADVGVAVAARPRRVLGVVAVDEVDAAGDGLDALDGVDQPLAGGPGVAGVEAEADAGVADVVPEPGDGVEVAGHGVVAAGRVLQVDRDVGLEGVEALAPAGEAGLGLVVGGDVPAVDDDRGRADLGGGVAGLLQHLAGGDPHPVVGRRQVDDV